MRRKVRSPCRRFRFFSHPDSLPSVATACTGRNPSTMQLHAASSNSNSLQTLSIGHTRRISSFAATLVVASMYIRGSSPHTNTDHHHVTFGPLFLPLNRTIHSVALFFFHRGLYSPTFHPGPASDSSTGHLRHPPLQRPPPRTFFPSSPVDTLFQ